VAVIVPFPIVRRRDFVLRNAARIAEAQPKTAEKLLTHTINVQVETMARRGIAPSLIACEARALENAVRSEIWRLVVLEGDTA
jgi:predicted urease superfamily metal-dependent hydrolase